MHVEEQTYYKCTSRSEKNLSALKKKKTLAPSLQKGKAKAEHRDKVLTTKKKAHVQTRLTQQKVINKYIRDHQDDWEQKLESAQQRFIEDLETAWDAPSDSESEQSYAEVMSQPGSSGRKYSYTRPIHNDWRPCTNPC